MLLRERSCEQKCFMRHSKTSLSCCRLPHRSVMTSSKSAHAGRPCLYQMKLRKAWSTEASHCMHVIASSLHTALACCWSPATSDGKGPGLQTGCYSNGQSVELA